MTDQALVLIGIGGSVLALDRSSGSEVWRTHLKGGDFVNVSVVEESVYAATKGELFCLELSSGRILWHNKLKGLGLGFVAIAGAQATVAMAALRRRQESDGGAAAAAASG